MRWQNDIGSHLINWSVRWPSAQNGTYHFRQRTENGFFLQILHSNVSKFHVVMMCVFDFWAKAWMRSIFGFQYQLIWNWGQCDSVSSGCSSDGGKYRKKIGYLHDYYQHHYHHCAVPIQRAMCTYSSSANKYTMRYLHKTAENRRQWAWIQSKRFHYYHRQHCGGHISMDGDESRMGVRYWLLSAVYICKYAASFDFQADFFTLFRLSSTEVYSKYACRQNTSCYCEWIRWSGSLSLSLPPLYIQINMIIGFDRKYIICARVRVCLCVFIINECITNRKVCVRTCVRVS